MNPRLSFITDLVLFQVAWFGCVLATRSPFPHLLPILVLLLVLVRVHLTRGLASVLPFTFSCLILGVIGDATLVYLDLLFFEPYPSLFGAPLWMVALWLNFGLMLRPLFHLVSRSFLACSHWLFSRWCGCVLFWTKAGRTHPQC
jgi:hypothetical protein